MLNSKLNVLIKYPLHKPVFELMELQWASAPLNRLEAVLLQGVTGTC